MKLQNIIFLIAFILFAVFETHGQKTIVNIDKRIELTNIVQYLAEDLRPRKSPYLSHVDSYFAKFKNHEAVSFYKKHSPKNFSWAIGITNGIALDSNYQLKHSELLLDDVKPWFKEFSPLLKKFAKETNFNKFIKQEEAEFNTAIKNFNETLEKNNFITAFRNYWGYTKDLEFTLSLLTSCGGMSPYANNNSFKRKVSVVGLCNSKYKYSKYFVSGIVWHESSHPIINPIIDKHSSKLKNSEILFEPYRKQLKWADGCEDWSCAVKETIVRAIVARLMYKNFSAEAGKRELNRQINLYGFVYTDEIFNLLSKFEANRQTYKNFEDFIPKIIAEFDSILEAKSVWHPNSLNLYELKPIVFVLPTNEKDKESQQSIWDSITKMIRKSPHLGNNYFITSDKDALNLDPNYTFHVYGTPSGNLLLKHYLADLPFTFNEKELVINNKKYTDPTLSTFIQIPNPKNPSFPLKIFSAFSTKYVTKWHWDYTEINFLLWNANKTLRESGKIKYERTSD